MRDRDVLSRKAQQLMRPKPAKPPKKYRGWTRADVSISFWDGEYLDIGRSLTVTLGSKPIKNTEELYAALESGIRRIVRGCLERKGALPIRGAHESTRKVGRVARG